MQCTLSTRNESGIYETTETRDNFSSLRGILRFHNRGVNQQQKYPRNRLLFRHELRQIPYIHTRIFLFRSAGKDKLLKCNYTRQAIYRSFKTYHYKPPLTLFQICLLRSPWFHRQDHHHHH